MEQQELKVLSDVIKNNGIKEVVRAIVSIAEREGDNASDMLLKERAISYYETADVMQEVIEEINI